MFLRFIIVGAIVYFMIKRRHGEIASYIQSPYNIYYISSGNISYREKPQVFSFFTLQYFFLLEKVEDEAGCYTLPLLMLVWANFMAATLLSK